jgi:hypothetical protein
MFELRTYMYAQNWGCNDKFAHKNLFFQGSGISQASAALGDHFSTYEKNPH